MRRVETENFVGTCQICHGEWKVAPVSEMVVLHGYLRPGNGAIHGECPGSNKQPFEHSKLLTLDWSNRLGEMRDRIASQVADVESGKCKTLPGQGGQAGGATATVCHVEAGWDEAAASWLRRAKQEIMILDQQSKFLQDRADAWEKGTIPGIDAPLSNIVRMLREPYSAKREMEKKEGALRRAEAVKKTEEAAAARKAAATAIPRRKPVLYVKVGLVRFGQEGEVGENFEDRHQYDDNAPFHWVDAINWIQGEFTNVREHRATDVDLRPMVGLSGRDCLYVAIIRKDEFARLEELVPNRLPAPSNRQSLRCFIDVEDPSMPWRAPLWTPPSVSWANGSDKYMAYWLFRRTGQISSSPH